MTSYSDNERVQVLRGTQTGKPATVVSLNVVVDGETSTRRYDFSSLKPLVVPPPAPVPTTAKPTWDGSADLGFGKWNDVQDGKHNPDLGESLITIVDSPCLPGHKAFRFDRNGGQRAELAAENDKFHETTVKEWIGDVLYVPKQTIPNGHNTVLQIKNDGSGSPPLNFDIRNWGAGDPNTGLDSQEERPGQQAFYRLVMAMGYLFDRGIPVEIGLIANSDPNIGMFEAWADGKQVIAPVKLGTLLPGILSYLKQGVYGEMQTVFWHGARRGPTRASVLR